MAISESSAQLEPRHDPDARLMLAVREGDALAFEQLVGRYQARLLRLLEHLLGSKELAEDVTQEVFLRVYRARHSYSPEAKFSTWLFTIANNAALNARRSQSRRREVRWGGGAAGASGELPLAELALARSALMPTRQLDRSEMREVVRASLSALNERQRLAVLLNKFEGLSYVEIGEAMQLSVPAVKSLLNRARVQLREVLEPYLERGQSPAAEGAPPPNSGQTVSEGNAP